MTEPRDAAFALPLSVTCAPDDRFADAVRALVGRVGALAADGHAQQFATAVAHVVAWVLSHPDAVTGDVAMVFDCEGDRLLGDLRWATSDRTEMPETAAASSAGVDVACGVEGAEVRCRVSCRCA